jgi:TPR repeat protein
MPVDWCVCALPLLIFLSAIPALTPGPHRKTARWITMGLIGLFLLIYFIPGWMLSVSAERGDPDAQYKLGNYYWTRLGYNWSDIEARDEWWVKAAQQGHPRAMYSVGYFSMIGTSKHIPRDLTAARRWLVAAQAAGDPDAASALRALTAEEAKEAKGK